MHIEFSLPSGAGGAAAPTALRIIQKQLDRWQDLYGIAYIGQVKEYTYLVTLPNQQDYSFFLLSFDPGGFRSPGWKNIKIVDDCS